MTVRLEDENLSTDECVLVAHRWENCPSHTIGFLQLVITWYKERYTGGQLAHWDI